MRGGRDGGSKIRTLGERREECSSDSTTGLLEQIKNKALSNESREAARVREVVVLEHLARIVTQEYPMLLSLLIGCRVINRVQDN